MKNANIIFAGTPDISAKILADLCQAQYNIQAVITQPDRAQGRGKKVKFSPVKEVALANNISIFQPLSFKSNPKFLNKIRVLKPDIIIVIAYGMILSKEFLNIPKYCCINIHASLLPQWRGAAPIQRSIQSGDSKTGITIIRMDEGLDTGDILETLEIYIKDTDTSQDLYDMFAKLTIKPLVKVLDNIQNLKPKKQCGKVTYAHKITKKDGLLDFSKSAYELSCQIRAFTPWPRAYFILDSQMIKVGEYQILEQSDNMTSDNMLPGTIINIDNKGFDVKTLDNIIRFKDLQFPNKKKLKIADILNGKNLYKYINHALG